MQRISVVGSSGSGKTTVARAISDRLGVPRVELDAVYHQPNWTHLDDEAFSAATAEAVAGDAWVIDGNYSSTPVQDIVWGRADAVVWLDLPRSVVMRQVVKRSLHRAATRQELWAGNTERWQNLFKWNPEENIVRWSWTRYTPTREKYAAKMIDPTWDHLEFVHLRTRGEVRAFLRRA